ncbi:hypothetical protein F3F42_07655, partial [Bacteroides ovatus]
LMSRTQKLNGLVAASLRLKTLNDNPYLFFLLFGLWGGSAIALSATSYMKKINHEELGKKQNSKDS